MPFEEIEVVVNAAVIAALTNAGLVHNGGATVRGIFERRTGLEFGTVNSVEPTFTIAASVTVARGDTFSDGLDAWVVIGIDRDASGLQVVQLARA